MQGQAKEKIKPEYSLKNLREEVAGDSNCKGACFTDSAKQTGNAAGDGSEGTGLTKSKTSRGNVGQAGNKGEGSKGNAGTHFNRQACFTNSDRQAGEEAEEGSESTDPTKNKTSRGEVGLAGTRTDGEKEGIGDKHHQTKTSHQTRLQGQTPGSNPRTHSFGDRTRPQIQDQYPASNQCCSLLPKFGSSPEFGVFQEIAQKILCHFQNRSKTPQKASERHKNVKKSSRNSTEFLCF